MHDSNYLNHVIFFIALLFVSSCTTSASFKSVNLNFENVSPLRFNISDFQIINEYIMPMKSPNIEHIFSKTPSRVLEDFINHKFANRGNNKKAKIIIKEASIIENKILNKNILNSIFMNENKTIYSGKLSVKIEFLSERGFVESYSNFQSLHEKTITGSLTLNNLQQVYLELLEELIKGLNMEIDAQISSYFSDKLL